MIKRSQLMADAKKRPDLFLWNGPVEPAALSAWLSKLNLKVPADLIEFWLLTGGGDLFETETFLGPFADPGLGDDVLGAMLNLRESGLPEDLVPFALGTFMGAADQRLNYVALDPESFRRSAVYGTLDEWYLGTLRHEYAGRYRLI
jgi:hypothetical protein